MKPAYRETHNKYQRKAQALRRAGQPRRFKEYKLKASFGITLDQYETMLDAQNHVCAICKCAETCTFKGKIRALAVDHDHTTGAVRSLLCVACNQSLGKLKENFDTALNMAKYIQEHKGTI